MAAIQPSTVPPVSSDSAVAYAPPATGCTCVSMKPGSNSRPPRSVTVVSSATKARASAVLPTKMISSPRTASASARGFCGSSV